EPSQNVSGENSSFEPRTDRKKRPFSPVCDCNMQQQNSCHPGQVSAQISCAIQLRHDL
ncbi:hypothetical protein ABEB36_005892, partial [Hypothenemus hampei]